MSIRLTNESKPVDQQPGIGTNMVSFPPYSTALSAGVNLPLNPNLDGGNFKKRNIREISEEQTVSGMGSQGTKENQPTGLNAEEKGMVKSKRVFDLTELDLNLPPVQPYRRIVKLPTKSLHPGTGS